MLKPDLTPRELNEIEISQGIKERLEADLNLPEGSKELPLCIKAFQRVAQCEPFFSQLAKANNQATFRQQLTSLKGHLDKIKRTLEEMGGANEQILNQSCWFVSEENFFLSQPPAGASSTMHYLVNSMLKGVDFHLKNMRKPTKEKQDYVASISLLADAFEKIFPNLRASKEPESPFASFALLWLESTQGVHMADPSRIIEKALSLRTE